MNLNTAISHFTVVAVPISVMVTTSMTIGIVLRRNVHTSVSQYPYSISDWQTRLTIDAFYLRPESDRNDVVENSES